MRSVFFVLIVALLLPSFAYGQKSSSSAAGKIGAISSSSAAPAKIEPIAPSSAPGANFRGFRGFKDMMKGDRPAPAERGQNSILSQLNLTPEQQKKVDEIMANNKKAQEGNRKEMGEQMKKLRELMNASDFDEAEFRQTHQKLSRFQEELMVSRAKTKMEIKKVLTPEQRVLYQKTQDEMRQRVFGMQSMLGNTDNQ